MEYLPANMPLLVIKPLRDPVFGIVKPNLTMFFILQGFKPGPSAGAKLGF